MITAAINVKPGDHAAHFYRGDRDLAETVAAYLAGALRGDGVAVAITTEPHLLAIRRTLAAVGADVQRAIHDQRLICLDAGATLAKLTRDGRIDRDAFAREVGSLMRSAGQRGREVRAYGEMVDLLWQEGNIAGAVELERLWNELGAELPFALLCAYHSEAIASPLHDHGLRTICQLHSSLSSTAIVAAKALQRSQPDRELTREFEPNVHAPRAARRFVGEALQRWGYDRSVIDDARLVTSELVTNAVVHTQSLFVVSIRAQAAKLRLAVADRGPALPPADARPVTAPDRGRGLKIIAALARDWGVVPGSPGKTVWAELPGARSPEKLHVHVA